MAGRAAHLEAVRHQGVTKDEVGTIYLEGLSRALSGFPNGRVAKSENPDFLVTLDRGTLAIELTRLF